MSSPWGGCGDSSVAGRCCHDDQDSEDAGRHRTAPEVLHGRRLGLRGQPRGLRAGAGAGGPPPGGGPDGLHGRGHEQLRPEPELDLRERARGGRRAGAPLPRGQRDRRPVRRHAARAAGRDRRGVGNGRPAGRDRRGHAAQLPRQPQLGVRTGRARARRRAAPRRRAARHLAGRPHLQRGREPRALRAPGAPAPRSRGGRAQGADRRRLLARRHRRDRRPPRRRARLGRGPPPRGEGRARPGLRRGLRAGARGRRRAGHADGRRLLPRPRPHPGPDRRRAGRRPGDRLALRRRRRGHGLGPDAPGAQPRRLLVRAHGPRGRRQGPHRRLQVLPPRAARAAHR